MKRVTVCGLAAGVLALAGCRSGDSADCFTRSGAAGCSHPPAGPTAWRELWKAGRTTSSAGGSGDGCRASAAVNQPGTPGIRLESVTSSPAAAHGVATAAGQLGDVIRVRDGGPAPDALRVRIEVEGAFSLTPARGEVRAMVGVAAVDRPGPVGDAGAEPPPANTVGGVCSEVCLTVNPPRAGAGCPTYSLVAANAGNLRGSCLTAAPGTTRRFVGPVPPSAPVRWEATFDLPYSPDIKGYRLNLYATAKVCARGGSAAGFAGTVRLAAVTLPDGSPVPGTLTFASGFALAPVGP
ncbi:MAG: hypothetical protein K2X82_02815 [Gemmataceae bacterium]|nr:hypothetical protein [Gemmataceae bacterium]